MSWLIANGWDKDDALSNYLRSIYFIITTMSTVGYGDISATNFSERIFCIILMFLGVVGFSFATGTLSTIISTYDCDDAHLRSKMTVLDKIYSDYEISFPGELYSKVKNEVHLQVRSHDQEAIDFIADLPPSLKAEMTSLIYSEKIVNIKLFSSASKAMVHWICPLLRPLKLGPNQVLFTEGDEC